MNEQMRKARNEINALNNEKINKERAERAK